MDRVENLRIWVELCDDNGTLFMSIREEKSVPDGGVYVCCHHEGTQFFFAGDQVDLWSLNAAIAENVRGEFEVVVTGELIRTTPDAFESMTDEHFADTVDAEGKMVEVNWSNQELHRMRQDFAPIHFVRAESLTLNL